MDQWKRNTYVLWLMVFLSAICWTSVIPFTPIFLAELGVTARAEFWTGLFTAIASVSNMVMAPVWGAVGDRFGRRLGMMRAGFFLFVGYSLLALVQTPVQLLGVRVFISMMTGFVPMAVALVGVSTPREHVGQALGMVQTAWPSGALLGPMIGGAIADLFGLRSAMWLAAGVILLCTVATLVLVREQFTPPPREASGLVSDLRMAVANPVLVAIICVTTISMASFNALDPVMVPFVKELIGPGTPSWLAGLLYSIPGVAFIAAAPYWARRGTRLGFHKTIAAGLLVSGLLYIPQALVSDPWVFGGLRFVTGLAGASVGPGVAALLATDLPRELRGRAFGLNQAASAMGAVIGPLIGGTIGSFIGQRGVFLAASAILLVGYLWVTRVLTPRLLSRAESRAV